MSIASRQAEMSRFRAATREVHEAQKAVKDAQERLQRATDALGHLAIEAITK